MGRPHFAVPDVAALVGACAPISVADESATPAVPEDAIAAVSSPPSPGVEENAQPVPVDARLIRAAAEQILVEQGRPLNLTDPDLIVRDVLAQGPLTTGRRPSRRVLIRRTRHRRWRLVALAEPDRSGEIIRSRAASTRGCAHRLRCPSTMPAGAPGVGNRCIDTRSRCSPFSDRTHGVCMAVKPHRPCSRTDIGVVIAGLWAVLAILCTP